MVPVLSPSQGLPAAERRARAGGVGDNEARRMPCIKQQHFDMHEVMDVYVLR